ncbi:condensation domain-containing protein [Actinokineospora diospyrosa]|uniref:Condensation domain-containing protein n=1 Tax=Actinokineospora diospyrosa TaxID=103728 RepID=A0ABT1IFL5_9PSEU|nr:condensation domain-containing protein [Actinokineospora diospyrosa]MCP2271368.1 Condensation domain-containing protein [Actinokineospora diospyrosa]
MELERVPVPFQGDGSGEAGLTWGQIGIWQAIARSGESRTMGGAIALPPGVTVEQVVATLRSAVGRHQALRTRLVFTDGRPRQSLVSSGEVVLEVVDATGSDPAAVADAVQERYASVPFDYEHEFPVRMAVVRSGGALTHMVAVYLHLAMDAGGLEVLIGELGSDPATLPPVTAVQPLAQALAQREPAALRQSAASLRYLEHVLRTVSPLRFGEPRELGDPTFRMVRYRSPATRLAVDAVARRAGISTSPVLLACFAVALAKAGASNPVMAMLMVSNRFRPGFADSVSTIVQISPYLIDVADITLGEAVARAARSTMNAYKHAYYDPDAQDEVVDKVVAERGEAIDFSCFFNDRRKSDRAPAGGADPDAESLTAALARSSVHWEDEPGMPRQKLYLHVDDPADAIEFTMSVDTRYFTATETEAVVRGIESVAVRTALDPDTPTGVRGETRLPATAGAGADTAEGGAR